MWREKNVSLQIITSFVRVWKFGGRKMEPSESESAANSNGSSGTDPKLGSQWEPSSPTRHPDQDREASDLNHVAEAEALHGELQNKLDLKDGDEGEGEAVKKVSDFDAAGGQVCDEAGAQDAGKDEGCDEDSRGWNGDDGWNWTENVNESDNWNENVNESDNWNENVNESDNWNENVNESYNWNENVNESYNWNENVNGTDNWNDNVGEDENVNGTDNWNDNVGEDVDGMDGDEVVKKEDRSSGRTRKYPLRPDAEDCAFFLKTGTCKFGFNCRFNHPVRRKNQVVKEKAGESEELAERSGQTECKYYQRSGGCKFGKACKYNHSRGKSSPAPILELNFLGLPIRLGEKECPYYMRNGSCKFGANCKFNHPDPTTVGGCDSPSGFGNGVSISLQGVSQPSIPSWSSPRTSSEAAPFVPMVFSPTHGVAPLSSDWNGYQAPVYLSERSMHPPTYVMNNPTTETNVCMHHHKQMLVEEFPERPGEPECIHFLKTGDCKFKSSCKFHHPKNRITRLSSCNVSDKGLPLRPDQQVCTHYSRYGICKFGPACKFDHPINPSPSTMSGLNQQSSHTKSAIVEVAGLGGSETTDDATIPQPI